MIPPAPRSAAQAASSGSDRWSCRAATSRTGRLVTSAALILGLAFVAFSAGPGTEAKIFATALGGGILIDATIIRGILAPASVASLAAWDEPGSPASDARRFNVGPRAPAVGTPPPPRRLAALAAPCHSAHP